ncbi:MAG: hypothetical protein OXE41_12170 [Gammaproteobacteria bacterium]|nr:hypothetical protein [Gammaproteobacteria bacterium]MCY4217746.1 hypothetical protein [Gammaproteobacteria bacterium]MCY4276125.1 hypothetical protein [Gammaproteobacteria bacterium]
MNHWYLVSLDGRQGWINSIALIPKVKHVAGVEEHEQRAADIHENLMANVFGSCLDYAYNKLVKSRGSDSVVARLAMFESVHPQLKEITLELAATLDLSALPESEIEQFYQMSLTNCKSGVNPP